MKGSYTLSIHAFQAKGHYQPLQTLDSVIHFRICETGTKMAKSNDKKDIGVALVDLPWKEQVVVSRGAGTES